MAIKKIPLTSGIFSNHGSWTNLSWKDLSN